MKRAVILRRERENKEPLWNISYSSLFFVNLLISMTVYMTNTLMAGHLEEKGIEAATVGAVLGLMSMASMCIRPLSGWICDRFSGKGLLVFFLFVNAGVMFGYSVAGSVPFYYALRILQGIAFGIVTTATMAYVASFIPDGRTGEGIGYFGLGQSIAAAIGPYMGMQISLAGNSSLAFAAAALLPVCGALLVLFVLPDDYREQKAAEKFHVSQFLAKEAVPYAAVTVVLSAVNGIETGYIVSYASEFSLGNVGWYFSVSAFVLFISRFCMGGITDKYDFSLALFPGLLLIGAALLCLGFAGNVSPAAAFAAAAVLKALGVGVLQPAIQAKCLKSVEAERRGAASSTYYIGTDLGQGGAAVIAGQLIPVYGYSGMFLFYMIPLLGVGIIYALVLWGKGEGKRKKRKK